MKTSIALLGVTIALKLIDVLKNVLSVSRFGVTGQGDLYNLIIALPEVLVVVVGLDTIKGAAMAHFTEFSVRQQRENADQLFSGLISWGGLLALALAGFAALAMGNIVSFMAGGFPPEKQAVAVQLAYIIVPVLIFRVLSGVLVSVLNANGQFVRVQILLALPAFTVIAVLIAADAEHLARNVVAAFATGVGISTMAIWALARKHVTLRVRLRGLSPAFWDVVRFAGTLIFATAMAQFAALAERRTASFYQDGTIAALAYASSLAGNILFLMVLSLFSVLQRDLGSHLSAGEKAVALRRFWEFMTTLMFAVLFAGTVLFVLRRPIIELLYLRQAFDSVAVERTTAPMAVYACWVIIQSIAMIATALLLAVRGGRIFVVASIAGYGLDILLVSFLATSFGPVGIAVSASLGVMVYAGILLWGVRQEFGTGSLSGMHRLARLVLAAIVAGLAMEGTLEFIGGGGSSTPQRLFASIVCTAAGLIVYLLSTSAFRVNALHVLRDVIQRKNVLNAS